MDRFFVQKQNINLETNTCIIEGEDVNWRRVRNL